MRRAAIVGITTSRKPVILCSMVCRFQVAPSEYLCSVGVRLFTSKVKPEPVMLVVSSAYEFVIDITGARAKKARNNLAICFFIR